MRAWLALCAGFGLAGLAWAADPEPPKKTEPVPEAVPEPEPAEPSGGTA